jgi:SNF2 family DNA or RNA helicase
MITELLESLGIQFEWIWGGCKDPINAVARFIGTPDKRVLVMNSEVGGTGTDGLQDVARYLVFYESPTSPITRKQVIKRVHRSGQKHRTFIYDLIIKDSIDIRVLDFIAEGHDLHAALIDGKVFNKQLLL